MSDDMAIMAYFSSLYYYKDNYNGVCKTCDDWLIRNKIRYQLPEQQLQCPNYNDIKIIEYWKCARLFVSCEFSTVTELFLQLYKSLSMARCSQCESDQEWETKCCIQN